MKISIDTIGIRTRDLPTFSAVPQPTAPPAACPFPHFLYANVSQVLFFGFNGHKIITTEKYKLLSGNCKEDETKCDAAASAQTARYVEIFCAYEKSQQPTPAEKRRLEQRTFCDSKKLV